MKRLGKGLKEILGAEGPGQSVTEIGIDRIEASRYQPREAVSEQDVAELVESVRREGVLQPIVVRPSGDGYELVFGERRWRAARAAGLKTVPAIVRETTEEESFRLALVENVQRRDLGPVVKARAVKRYMETFSLTQQQVAERLGFSRSTVANILRLLALPEEVKELVEGGRLSATAARLLLSLPPEKVVSEARRLAAEAPRRAGRRRGARGTPPLDPEAHRFRAVEGELSEALMRAVKVRRKRKGGVLELEFYSIEDLLYLAERISGAFKGGG